MKKILPFLFGSIFFIYYGQVTFAQSPGRIVRPTSAPYSTVLDPNQNGYTSLNISGFSSFDIGASYSEINYVIVPPAIIEPTGDLATGPSGGFSDIVRSVDGSGFYVYSNGTNICFRLRIGSIMSGSKGYSILIDVDGKMGNTGPNADPDYVAPTNTSNGNPGFEYEVVYETNFQVEVYNVNGASNPVSITTYPLSSNSQISVALSTDGNNPDYFYDWFVPLSIIGSPSSIRMVATTVTSPKSALQGSRSDIYGINDALSGVSTGWQSVTNAQPPISITGGGISTVSPTCTAAPVLNSPILPGSSVSVTGTWTRLDASVPGTATITLYKNGVSVNTTSVNTGNTWSITVPTIASGDIFYAKAQAAGESQCLQSNNVTSGCSSNPTPPSFANATINACASSKGMRGTVPLGATVEIYEITTSNNSPTATLLTTNLTYTTLASEREFDYYGSNTVSGNPCSGNTAIFNTASTYMLLSNLNGCKSTPVFGCIASGGNQNSQMTALSSNALTVTTPLYPYQTTVSGSGATSGQLLRLFINNEYKAAITASGSSFSFTGVTLNSADQLKIYVQAAGTCMTVSGTTTVSCYLEPPVMTTNTAGSLLTTSSSISGTSNYSGATITLYKGISPAGVSQGTTSSNGSGAWTFTGLTLVAGDSYYVTQTYNACTSPSSAGATVATATTICPSFGSATYSSTAGSIAGTLGSSFTGTVRLYLDDVQIGSVVVSGSTSWTINSPYTYPLYPGGLLKVTTQTTGAAEKSDCGATASITCTVPANPTISPTSITINTGQTVNFSVSNVVSNVWYAALDNSGTSYANSIYTSNTNNFSLLTKTFTSVGTYNLIISADELSGCAKGSNNATITVSAITLPVTFINVSVDNMAGGNKINWKVTNEQDVLYYEVEKSTDCNHFEVAGRVAYHTPDLNSNSYSFMDNNTNGDALCYRVKEVDINSQYKYSKIIRTTQHSIAGKIAPNPATREIKISISMANEEQLNIEILDLSGRGVLRQSTFLKKGLNTITLSGLGEFPRGTYIIKMITPGNTWYQQFVLH